MEQWRIQRLQYYPPAIRQALSHSGGRARLQLYMKGCLEADAATAPTATTNNLENIILTPDIPVVTFMKPQFGTIMRWLPPRLCVHCQNLIANHPTVHVVIVGGR